MIPRDGYACIKELLNGFPVVTLTGPRQSGKTTLARAVMPDRPYVSLEDPDVRLHAQNDPRSFLERFPNGGILDEVQRCPDLLSYLQTIVDRAGRTGLFLLTGSQQFGLISGITQSLAGRTAFIELLPFSISELRNARKLPPNNDAMIFTGGYPPLYDRPVLPSTWYGAYVASYVERDVRQLLKVHELDGFQRFVRLCAGRTGQLLNLSSIGNECGITHNTAKAWLSVMQASYLVFLLRPHHANFSKRVIKSPKLYFYDSGLAAWLLGIRTPEQVSTHPLRGALFETLIVSDLMKTRLNRAEQPDLYFWRDSNGNEIDVVAEQGNRFMPIEIKSGKTVVNDFFTGLEKWCSLAGDKVQCPTLIYGGDDDFRHDQFKVTSWKNCFSSLQEQPPLPLDLSDQG